MICYGEFHALLQEYIKERPKAFINYCRMTFEDFEELLHLVGPHIAKQNTTFRKAIPPSERLAVTLRFLATGDSFTTIAGSFRLGLSTVSNIIHETCKVIWKVLKDIYLKCPSSAQEWTAVADKFNNRWQFPNCIGAIDGKHVNVRAPNKSGSQFFNYKKKHSIVLMAVADACYRFLVVEVGAYGRNSDGGVFSNSCLGKRLSRKTLNIPEPRSLYEGGHPLPFVFISDEAFPLKEYNMRPFPGNGLTSDKKVFNYRLSRGRRIIESTFGIMANQWRVYHRDIPLQPDKVDCVIQATCCLHNFLRRSTNAMHSEPDIQSEPIEMLSDIAGVGGRATNTAVVIRNEFMDYFNSERGSVPWQSDYHG